MYILQFFSSHRTTQHPKTHNIIPPPLYTLSHSPDVSNQGKTPCQIPPACQSYNRNFVLHIALLSIQKHTISYQHHYTPYYILPMPQIRDKRLAKYLLLANHTNPGTGLDLPISTMNISILVLIATVYS